MGIEMDLPCNFAAGACNSTMEAFVAAYAKYLGDNITAGVAILAVLLAMLRWQLNA